MKNKLLTLLIILGVAAFIYYNKNSYIEEQRDRRRLEHNIENVTGLDLDLRGLFRKGNDVSRDITDLGEEKLDDLKNKLENLSREELNELSRLLDDKGDEMESLFQDIVKDINERDEN